MESLIPAITEFFQELVEQLLHPETGLQLVLIVVIFLPAWLLARKIKPLLEQQARKIKDSPGLLRLIVAFLRRLKWFFFALLLAIAYLLTTITEWPKNNYLIENAMLLAVAWWGISVVAHVIRSRVLRKAFKIFARSYVSATILGISTEIGELMDTAGFSVGTYRLSVLTLLQGALIFSLLMWAAINLGDFLDRRIQKIDELTPALRVLIGKVSRIT